MKLLLTLIISFFVVNSSFSQTLNPSISGKLVDADGFPISFVRVSIEGIDEGVLTDNMGAFSFQGLNPQTYTLIFTKKGFISQRQQIVLLANKSVYLEITL
ncbi:MAG: carboxypeptidase-like regulatory domain-containing protein, partial [Bacteroidota bacterium]